MSSLSWCRVTILSAVLTTALAVPAFAQVTFSATTYNSGGQMVTAGDVNGDGHPDLWAVDANFVNYLFLNNGDGTFGGAISTNVSGFFPRTGRLADLNGDGKLDIFGPDGSRVYVRLGNGNGTFGSPSTYNNPGGDQLAGAVDCNGDGIIDALTAGGASGNPQNISCLPGNGAGGFGAPILSAGTAFNLRDAQAGDINGDGFVDIAGLDGGSNTNLRVWLNNGAGVFTLSTQTAIGNLSRKLAIGDVNGDGFDDVIATTSTGTGTGSIMVYPGNASGAISLAASYAAGKSILGTGAVDYHVMGDVTVASSVGNFTVPYSQTGRFTTTGVAR